MSDKIDVGALLASVDIVEVASRYLELTKQGSEYLSLCCFHTERTPSLKFNQQKQCWACFGCGAHDDGASALDFVMKFEGIGFLEACERLKNGNGAGHNKPIIRPALKKKPPRETYPPPEDIPPDLMHRGSPEKNIDALGAPIKVWTIKTLDGKPWLYEARYGPIHSSTDPHHTRYWTWGRYSKNDPPRWQCGLPSIPRPYYGLEELAARPSDQVMIHEAPKKAEAARGLFPRLVHLGLIQGRNGVPFMDHTVLAGRRLVLLPDNDEVGKKAMTRLAELAWSAGAAEVKGIDPSTQPDGSPSPEGWDVADATDWTPAIALAWAKARKTDYAAPQDNKADPRAALSTRAVVAPSSGSLPNTSGPAGAAPNWGPETGLNQARTHADAGSVTAQADPRLNAAPEPGPVNPSVAPATPEPAQEAAPDSPERAQPHPKGNGGAGPPLTPAERAQAQETLARSEVLSSMVYRKASSVRMRATDWLWPGKIPLGEICVIQGDPGLGKSQITASLCAIITRGGQWPLTREPCDVGSVIVLSAEDSTAKTIVPRLAAAGADLDRVTILQSIKHEYGTRGFSLLADMLALDTLLGEEDNPMAVIVDPISAYQDPVGAGAKQHDSHKNTDVRSLLRPVSELVDRRNVTMILINHLTKGAGRAITRGQGNMAFVAGPRAVWQVSKDKDDPRKRLFLPVKNNLADDSGETGLSFSVEPVDLGMDDQGKPIRTSRILWNDERVTITADEAAGYDSLSQDERGSVSDAQAFLAETLADGRMKVKDVETLAKASGHSFATLGRAKRALGVISEREGFGREAAYYWRLPEQRAPAETRSWVKDD